MACAADFPATLLELGRQIEREELLQTFQPGRGDDSRWSRRNTFRALEAELKRRREKFFLDWAHRARRAGNAARGCIRASFCALSCVGFALA